LIQTIGRAARNSEGHVILYADTVTESMRKAIEETNRRREKQEAYNKEHGITPQTIRKRIQDGLMEIYEMDYSTVPIEKLSFITQAEREYLSEPSLIKKKVEKLKKSMKEKSAQLEFEEAAKLRDEIKRLEMLDLDVREA
jgi:excinuclease ABC subunit B